LLIASEHRLRQVLTEYFQHYDTARPHRALGQLAPAQGGTRPPEINLAEHRIRRNKTSADSRTSTRSPPNNPDRYRKPQVIILIVYSSPTGLTPTLEDGWVTQPQRPPDSGSCILRARPQVRHAGTGEAEIPDLVRSPFLIPGTFPLPSAFRLL
jgi:hypothetical protein